MERNTQRGIGLLLLLLGLVLGAGAILFAMAAWIVDLFPKFSWAAAVAGGQLLVGGGLTVAGLVLLIKPRH